MQFNDTVFLTYGISSLYALDSFAILSTALPNYRCVTKELRGFLI